MSKFQVGTRVRVTETDYTGVGLTSGSVGTVEEVYPEDENGPSLYSVLMDDNESSKTQNFSWSYWEEELEDALE